MRKALILFFVVLIPWVGKTQGTSYGQTLRLQNSALIDRLNLILGERIKSLQRCEDPAFHQKARAMYSYLKEADLNHEELVKQQKNILWSLLDLLRHSRDFEQRCLGSAQIRSIRKPFAFSNNTENQNNPLNRLWWKTLEPSCYKIRLKGELHHVDGNACFAGDRVVVKTFEKLQVDLIETSLRYSYSLLADLSKTPLQGDLNLENSYFNEFQSNNPTLLLSALAAIGSSGPSGLTGWLQGIEDRLLIQDLNSQLNNEQILRRFTDLQTAKYNYIVFRDTADRYKIKLKIYGQEMSSWSRHNVMAAFLGCSLRGSFDTKTPGLVYLTGVAYEAKDFISHLKEGVSLKASQKNFIDDTNRYKVSGLFGYHLCAPQ